MTVIFVSHRDGDETDAQNFNCSNAVEEHHTHKMRGCCQQNTNATALCLVPKECSCEGVGPSIWWRIN